MKHIDENILRLYAMDSDDVAGRRSEIGEHLRVCAGCTILFEEMRQYYAEVSQLQEERKESSHALNVRQMIMRVPPFTDEGRLSERPMSVPARFVLFVIRHPWVSSGSVLVFLLAGLFFLIPGEPVRDGNPAYARAKNEFLVVFNSHGDELWRKHAGIGYDVERMDLQFTSLNNFVTVEDVDNDGVNEVIAVFGYISDPVTAERNTIICYRSDGGERWRFKFHRRMKFGTERFSDDYIIGKMVAGDFDRDNTLDVVAMAFHHLYYPFAMIRLDARNGEVLIEYWHSGSSGTSFVADLDGDGVEELIFGGGNNGFNQANVLVLDPRSMDGHAPAPVAYTPVGVPDGREKYYILLPQSELNKTGPDKRNGVWYIRTTADSLLEVGTHEIQAVTHPPGLIYYFDLAMKCVRVDANDYYVETHRKMKNEGKLTSTLNDEYFDQLRQSVRYWDGEKFVMEPVMNKRYLEAVGELP